MRLNLFWSTFSLSIILLCLLFCIFKFSFEPDLATQFQASMLDSAREKANVGASMIAEELSKGCDAKKINQLTEQLSGVLAAEINITIPNCESGDLFPIDREPFRNQTDLFNALGGQISEQVKPASNSEQSIIRVVRPLLIDNNTIGAIQLEYVTDSPQVKTSLFVKPFYFYFSIAAVFAVFFSYGFSRGYSKRLLKIRNVLEDSVKENKTTQYRFSIFKDEISELEKAIKQQAKEIQKKLQQLSSNHKIFSATLSGMSDGILLVDENNQVKLINQSAADLFETTIEHAEMHSLVEGIRNHAVEEIFENCRQTQQIQMANLDLMPNHRYIHCIASPLTADLSGSVLLLFQDLTRIHQLEVIRQDFVSNVSHELRTPLASLKSLVETVQESAGKDLEATQKFLEMMNREIDNLVQMVQELLELSKIESGKVPLEKKPHAPSEIIQKADERMHMQIERAKLRLVIQCDEHLPKVEVDLERLEQVLVNLIHNAIKFTPPGGTITLTAEQQGNLIIFSVRDTGIGIPPRDLERIFERFYKVDRARSAQGTGLGLSIARHLVEAHGGKIWVESTLSQGSTFYFSIPLSA